MLGDYTKAVLRGSKPRKLLTGRVTPILRINARGRVTVSLDRQSAIVSN